MRIQKILSDRGLASRRQAEQMILEGRVCCNGKVCTLGQSADPDTDCITLDGVEIPPENDRVYLMLHKPRGYVTTLSDERGRKNAAMLVADCKKRVYPVGRLDMDSEGLLLFTNDGEFANGLMHPSRRVDKTYRVEVKGFSRQGLEELSMPMYLDGYRIAPPQVKLLQDRQDSASLLITIHEGRNRQVRRICARCGMQVRRLVRIREGILELGDLSVGKWRYLTEQEVRGLKHER